MGNNIVLPVSYTHLDVYKRQGESTCWDNVRNKLRVIAINSEAGTPFPDTSPIDVYKRQFQYRLISCYVLLLISLAVYAQSGKERFVGRVVDTCLLYTSIFRLIAYHFNPTLFFSHGDNWYTFYPFMYEIGRAHV